MAGIDKFPVTLTRRKWVEAATGAGIFLCAAANSFGASKFWIKKDPSAWTDDEVLQLATESPWANTARVLPRPGRDRGTFEVPPPDLVTAAGGAGRGDQEPGLVPVVPVAEVTVVWESAQPFLDSLKSTFPSDFANHYVIGVHRLPVQQGKHKMNLQNSAATLQARGRDPVDAGVIQPKKDFIICGFSKELLPLGPKDREIVFTLETEQYSIRTRFDPKEMIYRGKLAL